MITRLSVKWETLFKFFFPVIGWKLNLTTDIFFLYKTDKTFVTLLSKKKQWPLPMMWFPHKNRLYCRANALHRIMSLQDFYSHKRDLPGPPNIQTITEGKYLGGGLHHYRIAPIEERQPINVGYPWCFAGTITWEWGCKSSPPASVSLRTELMNSQMGVVKSCFASV